jgi:hypothetical protein
MSIFGKGIVESYISDEELPEVGVYGEDSAVRIMTESNEDFLEVIKAYYEIGMREVAQEARLKNLEASGEYESVQEQAEEYALVMENMIKNAFTAILNFFKKVWAKIKQMFEAIRRYFDKFFMSSKDFLKKYKTDIDELNKKGLLAGYKYKMYKYTNLEDPDFNKAYADMESTISKSAGFNRNAAGSVSNMKQNEEAYKKMSENKEEILDKVRGLFCKDAKVEQSDYADKLFAHYRGEAKGPNDKSEVPVNLQEVYTKIEGSKAKKALNDFMKDGKDHFTKMISDLNKKVSNAERISEKAEATVEASVSKAWRAYATLVGTGQNIALQSFKAWERAVKEEQSALKSILYGAFGYAAKKKREINKKK